MSPTTSAPTTSAPMPGARATARLEPSGLTVLYDADCPVCRQARRWAERQRQLVPLEFVASGSSAATQRFPGLDVASTRRDVTAITDDGAVFRDDQAWIAVLWCVATTRATAIQLALGRRRRMFRSVKGVTEAVRSIVAGQPDTDATARPAAWSPPQPDQSISCAQPNHDAR